MLPPSIWIGFDPREAAAFAVARASARRLVGHMIPIFGVVLSDLRSQGLYSRPMQPWIGRKTSGGGKVYTSSEPSLWDVISDAPCSTEFANSRFLVPHLVRQMTKPGKSAGWALFMDCDVVVRSDLSPLFEYNSDHQGYAVRCVKHDYTPRSDEKMDGQAQTVYPRKNWSSVMLFNCDHPANAALTPEMVNSLPGRDLHRFCWLDDDEIGSLGPEWNHLVGESQQSVEPKIVHFTNGGPWMRGYENVAYADEWREHLAAWATR